MTVVICAYNSTERLPETLRHLANQTVPERIPWGVVVVDTASPNESADVALHQWSAFGSPVPLRIVTQSIPGVAAARDKGIGEARYELILFCDDDNWLGADYVRLVHELLEAHPHVGAVGGVGRAVAETDLPGWFADYARYYAVGPQGGASGEITDPRGYLYGTGLAVRRSALLRMSQLDFRRRLSDRMPGTLTSGGDVELSDLLRLAGCALWFDERLEFCHFMPPGRLRWPCFLCLVEGAHRSRPIIDAYLRALRGEAEGVGLLRGLAACWEIAWRLVRRPMVLAEAMQGREGSHASHEWRRVKGELAGWLSVRSGHSTLCRDLTSLRARLADQLQLDPPGMAAHPLGTTPAVSFASDSGP